MLVNPVLSSGVTAGPARGGEASRTAGAARPGPAAPAAAAAEAPALTRGGLRIWNTQLNRQLASAQQALHFLDDAASQLQGLKTDLGGRLAGREAANGPLPEQLQQFQRTWRNRPAATGGSLGPQLDYSPGEPARQPFTVRGLDLPSLRAGEKETLSFALAGSAPRAVAVGVEPGLPDAALVQRFDQALSAVNLRASRDAQGNLVLSTPEAHWPAVRESLAIQGGGIRFPTGQFNRVRTEAPPEAVQPQQWKLDDAGAVRQTLQQVLQALQVVGRAHDVVSRALADAGQRLQQARPADEAGWAEAAARDFEAVAKAPDAGYRDTASIAAALSGVRRDRVLSLLSLR